MKQVIFIAALILSLYSCTPFALVNSMTYNDANLNDYKTFRIVTPNEGKLPPGMEMVTYYNIAAAIREQMVERGFSESPSSDLLVNIALTVKRRLQTEQALPPPGYYQPFNDYYPYYMYPRTTYFPQNYMAPRVIVGIYKEGVLTMELVDMSHKLPLYASSVATIMQPGNPQFRNLTGIAKAVNVLFSDFPIKLLPQYQHSH